MGKGETLETNGESHIARAYDVLNLAIEELGGESELLDDASVLPGGQTRCLLALGARTHHLARCKDERGRLRLANSHDYGSETLRVVLGVTCMQRDVLQVELAPQIHRGDDVSVA